MEVRISHSIDTIGVRVLRLRNDGAKKYYLDEEGEWVEYKALTHLGLNDHHMWEYEELQSFVDAAAKLGIKAKDSAQTEGKIDAMSRHLEDMRTLVFAKRGIKNG